MQKTFILLPVEHLECNHLSSCPSTQQRHELLKVNRVVSMVWEMCYRWDSFITENWQRGLKEKVQVRVEVECVMRGKSVVGQGQMGVKTRL